jgi:hypothetical protein
MSQHISEVEPVIELNSAKPLKEWKISEDEMILRFVATGLILLARNTMKGNSLKLPYPDPLQRGLDKLYLVCLRKRVPPPQGVPELLRWCRKPIKDWPLDLAPDLIESSDCLLDGQIPTAVCDAWASTNPDVESEIGEQKLMRSVIDTCRSNQAPNTYVAFRQLLIEHPVLTALEFQNYYHDTNLYPVREHLTSAYEAAPLIHSKEGRFACCGNCGNLLIQTVHGDLICEEERCRANGPVKPGREIASKEEVFWLLRELRRYIVAPGRVELRLAQRLQKLGLQVELWPAFDAYDLRIVFSDQDAWAIDVKDWAVPSLLARQVQPIPPQPNWDLGYFVFPEERRVERPDYKRAFRHHCSILDGRTRALFERELIAVARRRQKGIK